MEIGDEVDTRGEEKDPEFRRAAARRMGTTVPDLEAAAQPDEPADPDDPDDGGVGDAVRETGLRALGRIAESVLPE